MGRKALPEGEGLIYRSLGMRAEQWDLVSRIASIPTRQ